MLSLSHILTLAGRTLRAALMICAVCVSLNSCVIDPPLHLVDPGEEIQTEFQRAEINLNILMGYDFEKEWYYGWDALDNEIFGFWELQRPDTFHLRRYWTGTDPNAAHTPAMQEMFSGMTYRNRFRYGYYDLLIWNEVSTLDGAQALIFDESTSLEYVRATTNQTSVHTGAPQYYQQAHLPAMRAGYAFYEPEFLYAAYKEDVYISRNPEDYDYFDPMTHYWVKKIPMAPEPVTYIYLPQIIIHHNNGKISGILGQANLTGMARDVNLNTHITSPQDISVAYKTRLKKNMSCEGEMVDIIGGRLFTFGITGTNPYRLEGPPQRNPKSASYIPAVNIHNYLEVPVVFNNGIDSTFVFDVTDQVLERYRGGVLTIHIDADTISVPSHSGGSGFDAVVKEWEEEEHEFEM